MTKKLYVTFCDHLKLFRSLPATSMLTFHQKCWFQYRSHRLISFKSAKNCVFYAKKCTLLSIWVYRFTTANQFLDNSGLSSIENLIVL